MRQHWLLFFALCAPGIFAVPSRTLATYTAAVEETDQRQVGPIDNGQLEQQHPLTTLDNASASQKCAVCEGITDMIGTPIEELFSAAIRIEPNSLEATCQVHAPLRQPDDPKISRNGMGEVENVYLLKVAGGVYFNIYFGRSTSEAQGSSFAPLWKQPDTESSSNLRRIRPANPEWIDLDILKEWVGTRTHDHGEACKNSPYAAGLNLQRPSYLIDAVEGRLVDTSSVTEKSLHYVALRHPRENHDDNQSYSFVSTENIAQLQESGALLSPRFAADMSATFRDAIELVRLLDYRYLWIPTLCIIQDDPKSQVETVKVGDILVGAVFSVTQFFDINSTQGIRSIKELTNPQPRSLVQQLHPWGEETLVPFAHPVPMRNVSGEAATSTSQIRMTTERFLSGTVDRVFLYIRSSDYVRSYSNQPYHLYGGNGQHVGVLQSTASDDLSRVLGMPTLDYANLAFQFSANQSEEVPRDFTARLEVIALSRMYTRWGSGLPGFMKVRTTRYQGDQYYEFYNVMWIEWKDGVAYRKGIGRVLAEFWEDLS